MYVRVGLARTIYRYIRCIYGIFGREIIKYTVYMYGSGQPLCMCVTGKTYSALLYAIYALNNMTRGKRELTKN